MAGEPNAALFDLSGRVAVVTGGSRGLGREMVLAFARAGADVVIASRKLDNCEALAAEVRDTTGQQALAVECHVGYWDQNDALCERVYDEFGHCEVLVNNAGLSPLYPSLYEVSEALFDKVIDVNLKGPFRASAVFGKRMYEAGGGSIINVSSVAAVAPSPNETAYGAAKAGIHAITQSFAREYAPRVIGIAPGKALSHTADAVDQGHEPIAGRLGYARELGQSRQIPVAQHDGLQDLVVVDGQVIDPGFGDDARVGVEIGDAHSGHGEALDLVGDGHHRAGGVHLDRGTHHVSVEQEMQVLIKGDPPHDGLAGGVVDVAPGVEVCDAGGQLLQRHVGKAFQQARRLGHLPALHLRHARPLQCYGVQSAGDRQVVVDDPAVPSLFRRPAANPFAPCALTAEQPLAVPEVVRQVLLGEHIHEEGAASLRGEVGFLR